MFWCFGLDFVLFWGFFFGLCALEFFCYFLSRIIAYKEDKIYVDFISVPKHNVCA